MWAKQPNFLVPCSRSLRFLHSFCLKYSLPNWQLYSISPFAVKVTSPNSMSISLLFPPVKTTISGWLGCVWITMWMNMKAEHAFIFILLLLRYYFTKFSWFSFSNSILACCFPATVWRDLRIEKLLTVSTRCFCSNPSSKLGLPMWKINLRISNNLYHAHEELTDA